MALKTKIIVQQTLNIDDTTTTASKYPKYTVVLGNSISSITAGQLTAAVEASAASAAAAKDSENAAKTSEINAKTSETNAKTSETNALTSKNAAAASQTAAATSATNAKTSETNAKTSETSAKASEIAALASKNAAKTSETNAKTSETNAKTSETNALASKNAAAASQTAAKTSETNAEVSETNAKASELAAATSAMNAATSETNALASKNAAATSQIAAKTSETNAKTSETKAKTSETNAKTSETNAKTSETKAKTSETNAAAYAAAAKNSETNAALSAASASESKGFRDEAETFATQASTSALAAKNSETNAKTSEINSKASEDAAKLAQQAASGSASTAMQAVITVQNLKSDVEQLKSDTQTIKDGAVGEINTAKTDATTSITQSKDAALTAIGSAKSSAIGGVNTAKVAGVNAINTAKTESLNAMTPLREAAEDAAALATQKATTATQKATEAAGSATTASEKATNATSAADRAETAAASAAQVMQASLKKDQNLADLTDKVSARGNLGVDSVRQTTGTTLGDYNAFTNPQATYELRIANNGDWRVARNSDNATSALPIGAGGTGATDVNGARTNLRLGEGQTVTFSGVNALTRYDIESTNGGIYHSTLYSTSGSARSQSRFYNAINGATGETQTVIHTKNLSNNIESYCTFNNSGLLSINALGVSGKSRTATLAVTDRMSIGTPGDAQGLGARSIAIGDSDTGFAQRSDGVLDVYTDSLNLCTFNGNGFSTLRAISSSAPNDSRGMYVYGVRAGAGSALITGQVQAGGHGEWRDRAAGLLVEIPSRDGGVNIWKSVRWGDTFASGADVVIYGDGNPYQRLLVGNTSYGFNSAGQATAVAWQSTSDIRLKAQLKEIVSAKDKVKVLQGYTYFKRNSLEENEHSFYTEEAGLIAQDVVTVLPEAVYKVADTDYLSINYAGVTALLTNAIKEIIEDNDKQQKETDELKLKVATLEQELDELKKLVSELITPDNS
ncbi:tail fibers protein [Bacteriophage T5-like cott162]|uniref:Tail fibers protein n=3 Tax=Epseptimavirus saus132 TaxID=2732020 RepID=A0A2K8HQF3_9CAUD|nr:tail fibers protein [Bacteriophage T5-like cott162]